MGRWNGLHADSNSPYRGMTRDQIVEVKRKNRMAQVDAYPTPVRELIHDYGLTVVKCIYDLGVKKPAQIKQIVETVLDEFSPTRGSFSSQGNRAREMVFQEKTKAD